MKCPVCGAWSNVLATRTGPDEWLRRRRECANGHRFGTLEVLPTVVHKGTAAATTRAMSKRRELWKRDEAIRSDNRLQREIAADYGLTRHQVGKIKQGIRH